MPRSRARPTWTRGMPRCSPGGSRAPANLHEVSRAARSAPPPGRRAAAVRSAAGRAGRPGHRGTRPGGTPAETGSAGLCRRRDHPGGAPAMEPGGRGRRGDGVGRGVLACDSGPRAPVLPRGRLARPAGDLGELDGHPYDLARRFRGGRFADRGGGGDRGGDRDPPRPARGRIARRIPGGRSRGRPADRGRDHGCPSCGTGCGHPMVAVGLRHPLQRARPLRESPGRGASRRAGA